MSTTQRFKGDKTAHKPKGPGGGQFTGPGGGGGGDSEGDKGKKEGGDNAGKSKSEIAKAAHTVIDKVIQRYSENVNEPALAKGLDGKSWPDNEPVDVTLHEGNDMNGKITHGLELKTVIKNKAGKITMKGSALALKRTWARKNKAPVHTVVFNDTDVYNAKGEGEHDPSKRTILYRRGVGSFNLKKMYVCKDLEELHNLIHTPTKKLPKGAK